MINDVDKLAVSSQENVGEAMEKINAINIDELNQAIRNLSDVVLWAETANPSIGIRRRDGQKFIKNSLSTLIR